MAKTVVVTGGSRGIGKETCLRFAKEKYNVVICYNSNEAAAQQVAGEVSKLGGLPLVIKGDVSKLKDCQNIADTVLKTFGKVDVLVNNAGVALQKLLLDSSEEDIQQCIGVDLLGTINMCKVFYSSLASIGSGAIVNVSSMWGVYGGSGESVYSAAKAGVIGLTKALAKELGNMGVRVNAVAPGTIKTDMTKGLSKATLKELTELTSLKRLGTPSDIASVIYFLASEDAAYITGQVISVDGGLL